MNHMQIQYSMLSANVKRKEKAQAFQRLGPDAEPVTRPARVVSAVVLLTPQSSSRYVPPTSRSRWPGVHSPVATWTISRTRGINLRPKKSQTVTRKTVSLNQLACQSHRPLGGSLHHYRTGLACPQAGFSDLETLRSSARVLPGPRAGCPQMDSAGHRCPSNRSRASAASAACPGSFRKWTPRRTLRASRRSWTSSRSIDTSNDRKTRSGPELQD
jgi:hypothetical protein